MKFVPMLRLSSRVAAVIAAGLLAAMPAAANADSAPADVRGGGCGQWQTSGIYRMESCVSMDHITVVTGAWMTLTGTPAHGCELDITAYSGGQWAGSSTTSCGQGYHGGPSWWSIGSDAQTVVDLKINGKVILTAYSQIQYT